MKKSILPIVLEKITTSLLKIKNMSDYIYFDRDIRNALIIIIEILPQFDKSFLETQEMISKEVVDAIVDEKFNEKNCFLAFKVCMMLIKNNILVEYVVKKSLRDIIIRLNSIPCKERECTLCYSFMVMCYGYYEPSDDVFHSVYRLLTDGTKVEKIYAAAFFCEAVNKDIISDNNYNKKTSIEKDEEEEEELTLSNMPDDIVESIFELIAAIPISTDLLIVIMTGLNKILFNNKEILENIVQDDDLIDSFHEFIGRFKFDKDAEIWEATQSIASLITQMKETLEEE